MRAIGRIATAGLALIGFAVAADANTSAPNGQQLYKQRCLACHSIAPGAASSIGPNLAGIAGRKAATTGFAYSPALKASGLVWTKANLDDYLAAPTRKVPGTRMVIAVSDPTQRAAIVQYLLRPIK